MVGFDYTDPRSLVIGASIGGTRIREVAKEAWERREKPLYRYCDSRMGEVRVALRQSCRALGLYMEGKGGKELPRVINDRDIRC